MGARLAPAMCGPAGGGRGLTSSGGSDFIRTYTGGSDVMGGGLTSSGGGGGLTSSGGV